MTHQIPPEPAYFRVKVRRRLERIGAVLLKNSVYVLPTGEDTLEDFEWLRQEIDREGGETTLCLASFMDDETDERLVGEFRRARAADYRSIREDAEGALRERRGALMDEKDRVAARSRAAKLRRRLEEVVAKDFFDAPGRTAAQNAIGGLEAFARGDSEDVGDAAETADRPVGKTWVTREGVKVDRIASAWLIRGFIDPAARFKFVPSRGYSPEAGELRFDMFEGEFTHVGNACTFETLLARFDLDDAGLAAIGEIVHDIDCKDDKFGRPETSGVASLIEGIALAHEADEARLDLGTALFESLYEGLRSTTE